MSLPDSARKKQTQKSKCLQLLTWATKKYSQKTTVVT